MATAPPRAPTPRPTAAPAAAPRPAGPRMMGKVRKTWLIIVLSLVTFGIYFLVWLFLNFHEMNKQNRQDTNVVWFILGIFLGIPLIVYIWKEINKMRGYRTAAGLPPGPGPGNAFFLLLFGVIILPIILNKAAREYWVKMGAPA